MYFQFVKEGSNILIPSYLVYEPNACIENSLKTEILFFDESTVQQKSKRSRRVMISWIRRGSGNRCL